MDRPGRSVVRRTAAAAAVAAALAVPAGPAAAAAVDLALVLAVDCSQSVDEAEFRLQMDGIAAALRHPGVVQAIEAAPGGIAVTLMQWSGARTQVQAVPWSALRDGADTAALAARIAETGRLAQPGSTAIGAALAYGQRLLESGGYEGRRRVIDISGDGTSNQGEWPVFVRPRVLGAGITINGLAILGEEPHLDRYYEERIIGGPGAFMLRATGYEAFAEAMARKLIREIAGAPEAGNAVALAREAAPEPAGFE